MSGTDAAPKTSSGFEFSLEKIFQLEGGGTLTRDPTDRGGTTKWGISQRAFPEKDIENLSRADAAEIYRAHYWDPIRGDQLWEASPPLALMAFDGAVQHGLRPSILLLQRALSVEDDGVLGSLTLDAARRDSPHGPAPTRLLTLRAEYYMAIIAKFPPQIKFRKGWFQRLFLLSGWVQELRSRYASEQVL